MLLNGSMGEWVSKCEMYVFHNNQIGSTINSQSNFLFLLQIHVSWYFYLLVWNSSLTLVFHKQMVAIKKLTLVHTVRINWQTRSQFISTSRKMFRPICSVMYEGHFNISHKWQLLKTGIFNRDFLKIKVCGIPEDSWRRVKLQINKWHSGCVLREIQSLMRWQKSLRRTEG